MKVWWVGVLQTLCIAAAQAAPDDDYRRGQQAFQRGDVGSALGLLQAPAKAGHAASQTLLAFLLDNADSAEEAARLYAAAAAQDHAQAHAALANLLLTGRGIAKDEKQALLHFSKAAELGDAVAIELLADAYLKGRLGSLPLSGDDAAAGAAVRRAAERDHLPAVDALARASRDGGYGLSPDTTEAARWRRRSNELRSARSGAASKARP